MVLQILRREDHVVATVDYIAVAVAVVDIHSEVVALDCLALILVSLYTVKMATLFLSEKVEN